MIKKFVINYKRFRYFTCLLGQCSVLQVISLRISRSWGGAKLDQKWTKYVVKMNDNVTCSGRQLYGIFWKRRIFVVTEVFFYTVLTK
jgi:hypothetical protein